MFPMGAMAATGDGKAHGAKFDREQLESLKTNLERQAKIEQAVYISPDIDTTKEENIRVIVELKGEPVAAAKQQAKLTGKTLSATDVTSAMSKVVSAQKAFTLSTEKLNLNARVTSSYHYVFNGVALEIAANKVPELIKATNVKAVYPNLEYKAAPIDAVEPNMNESGPHVGSTDIWDLGWTGVGIKVGVVDTGIDYMHPDLADVYAGGWDFVNNDADPYETTPGERPADMPEFNEDGSAYYTSHGTHVSGTIAAQGVQDTGIMGIAPDVELHAYKVLGPYGSGTSEWVIGGIEQAVIDGMDVINLSLGNSLNDPDYPTSVAMNNAMIDGTVAVTSNGNSGPGRWTVGSPSSSAFAISVGASTPPGDIPLAIGTSSLTDATTYDLRVMAYNTAEDYTTQLLNQPLEIVYVGLGYPEDYAGQDFIGKIALIKRGELAFVDKIANATAAGATAAIIFNRDDLDGHAGFLAGDSLGFIPTFDMKGTDGRALLAALEASPASKNKLVETDIIKNGEPKQNTPPTEQELPVESPILQPVEKADPVIPAVGSTERNVETSFPRSNGSKSSISAVKERTFNRELVTNGAATFTLTAFMSERDAGDKIADFSSRGPVMNNLSIKPDVVAPGVSIRSTVAAYGKEDTSADYTYSYERYQGTSMASPHVAALAALLLQAHPDWSVWDVKAALMNNSKVLDGYNVFTQGSGRVQGLESVQAPAIVQVLDTTWFTQDGVYGPHDDITGSITFGNADLTADFTNAKTLMVTDQSATAQTYAVTAEFLNTDTTGVTLDLPTTVDVAADGTANFTATMNVDAETAVQGEYQGYIYLSNGTTTLHVPFVVFVGEVDLPKGIEYTVQIPEDFSPNDDGVLDNTVSYFGISNDMMELYWVLWSPVYGDIGFVDWYIGDADNLLPKGYYGLTVDGTYLPFEGNEFIPIPDGDYTLDLYAYDEDLNEYVKWNDMFVDREAPTVNVDSVDPGDGMYSFLLDGHVNDLYSDLGQAEDKLALLYTVMNGETELNSGNVTLDADGNFTDLEVTSLAPGENTIVFSTADIAGNVANNAGSVTIIINQEDMESAAAFPKKTEVTTGETFEVDLVAMNNYDIVGAEFELHYDDSVLEITDVKATDSFIEAGSGVEGAVTVANDDLGYNDVTGLRAAKLGAALEGEVNGVNGVNPIVTVTFKVKDVVAPEKLGETHLNLVNAKFIDNELNEVVVTELTSGTITIIQSEGSVTGMIKPEAFMLVDDSLNDVVDYSQIGASVAAKNLTTNEMILGTIHSDGSFTIDGLDIDATHELTLSVPGHFTSVIQWNGEDTVDFGLQLAGDIDRNEVIDIYDVAYAARYQGYEWNGTSWTNPLTLRTNSAAGSADINQDGSVDEVDLGFTVDNYAKSNPTMFDLKVKPQLTLSNGMGLKQVLNAVKLMKTVPLK